MIAAIEAYNDDEDDEGGGWRRVEGMEQILRGNRIMDDDWRRGREENRTVLR